MARVTAICIILYILHLTEAGTTNVVTKECGTISFYERDWTHTYTLGLKDYVENAWVLRNTTSKIKQRCDNEPMNENCIYFQKNLEANADMVEREVKQITNCRRQQRSFFGSLVKGILKDILIFAGATYLVDKVHESKIDEMGKQLRAAEANMAGLMNITVMQNGLIIMNSENIMKLQKYSLDLNETVQSR